MFDRRPQPETPGTERAVPFLAVLDRYSSMPLVFGVLVAAMFLIAWNRGIAMIYVLLAILAALALVSALGPLWMLRAARLRLTLPPESAVGETLVVGIAVEPATTPARRYFVKLEAPFPFAPRRTVFLSACGAGRVRAERVRCARRGVFELRDAAVSSSYPIGLFSIARIWPVVPARITVLPRTYPVQRFALPPGSARNSGELGRPSPSVGQEMIREVREYRAGDNPRHIHWPSSARHDRLMVKQFDAIATSETWIVLDLDPGSHDERGDSLERAVEIAATLATHLIGQGQRCGVAGGLARDGSPPLLLPPKAGPSQLRAVLHALAAVQAAPGHYAAVLAALAPMHRRGQQWILFDHGPDRMPLPAFLRGAPAPLRFRFDTASFVAADTDAPGRAAPTRLPDGFAVARDTDCALVFR